jgi:hypothetical protein
VAVHLSHPACTDGGVDPIMRERAADQIKPLNWRRQSEAVVGIKAPKILHEGLWYCARVTGKPEVTRFETTLIIDRWHGGHRS